MGARMRRILMGPAGKPSHRGMTSRVQPRHGSTVVLWRRPTRIVEGRPIGGYTEAFWAFLLRLR